MAGTIKPRDNGSARSGGAATPAAEQEKSISQLLDEYNLRGVKVKELTAYIEKNPNATDLDEKRAEISSLNLQAAATLNKMVSLAKADKSKHSELMRLFGNDENILEKLADKIKERMSEANKYGSRVKNEIPKTTLDDIIGQEDVKDVVRSFVFLAQHAELFDVYKMKGGLGMMMYGAPGTGKTMFAEAIANAMQLPLFVITPADIFKSYVGASEQAVRHIFQDIASFPDGAILFVDECESIFSKRGGDSKDYKSAVTSELLQRMNGEGVDGSRRIMIAATNRPWDIDPAYLRYKRFSHLIHIGPPSDEAIASIIGNKLKGIPQEDGVVEYAAALLATNKLGRYSAADVCGIVEEACRMAIEQYMSVKRTNDKAEYTKVSKEMIDAAVAKRQPSIKLDDLKVYENFSLGSMLD